MYNYNLYSIFSDNFLVVHVVMVIIIIGTIDNAQIYSEKVIFTKTDLCTVYNSC